MNKIYYSTGKNIPSEIANPSKNLLLGFEFNLWLCVYSSSNRLKTPINCYKTHYQPNSFTHSLINLLYWLIEPISYFFWVWVTICDLTYIYIIAIRDMGWVGLGWVLVDSLFNPSYLTWPVMYINVFYFLIFIFLVWLILIF